MNIDEEDLSREIFPLSHYATNRSRLVNEAFSILRGQRLESTIPPSLRGIDYTELKSLCLDELQKIDTLRIVDIIEGRLSSNAASSGESKSKNNSGNDPTSAPPSATDPSSRKRKSSEMAEPSIPVSVLKKKIKKSIKNKNKNKDAEQTQEGGKKSKKVKKKKKNSKKEMSVDPPSSDQHEIEAKGKDKKKMKIKNKSKTTAITSSKKSKKEKKAEKLRKKAEKQKQEALEQQQASRPTTVGGERTLMELLELEYRAKAIKALLKFQGFKGSNIDQVFDAPDSDDNDNNKLINNQNISTSSNPVNHNNNNNHSVNNPKLNHSQEGGTPGNIIHQQNQKGSSSVSSTEKNNTVKISSSIPKVKSTTKKSRPPSSGLGLNNKNELPIVQTQKVEKSHHPEKNDILLQAAEAKLKKPKSKIKIQDTFLPASDIKIKVQNNTVISKPGIIPVRNQILNQNRSPSASPPPLRKRKIEKVKKLKANNAVVKTATVEAAVEVPTRSQSSLPSSRLLAAKLQQGPGDDGEKTKTTRKLKLKAKEMEESDPEILTLTHLSDVEVESDEEIIEVIEEIDEEEEVEEEEEEAEEEPFTNSLRPRVHPNKQSQSEEKHELSIEVDEDDLDYENPDDIQDDDDDFPFPSSPQCTLGDSPPPATLTRRSLSPLSSASQSEEDADDSSSSSSSESEDDNNNDPDERQNDSSERTGTVPMEQKISTLTSSKLNRGNSPSPSQRSATRNQSSNNSNSNAKLSHVQSDSDDDSDSSQIETPRDVSTAAQTEEDDDNPGEESQNPNEIENQMDQTDDISEEEEGEIFNEKSSLPPSPSPVNTPAAKTDEDVDSESELTQSQVIAIIPGTKSSPPMMEVRVQEPPQEVDETVNLECKIGTKKEAKGSSSETESGADGFVGEVSKTKTNVTSASSSSSTMSIISIITKVSDHSCAIVPATTTTTTTTSASVEHCNSISVVSPAPNPNNEKYPSLENFKITIKNMNNVEDSPRKKSSKTKSKDSRHRHRNLRLFRSNKSKGQQSGSDDSDMEGPDQHHHPSARASSSPFKNRIKPPIKIKINSTSPRKALPEAENGADIPSQQQKPEPPPPPIPDSVPISDEEEGELSDDDDDDDCSGEHHVQRPVTKLLASPATIPKNEKHSEDASSVVKPESCDSVDGGKICDQHESPTPNPPPPPLSKPSTTSDVFETFPQETDLPTKEPIKIKIHSISFSSPQKKVTSPSGEAGTETEGVPRSVPVTSSQAEDQLDFGDDDEDSSLNVQVSSGADGDIHPLTEYPEEATPITWYERWYSSKKVQNVVNSTKMYGKVRNKLRTDKAQQQQSKKEEEIKNKTIKKLAGAGTGTGGSSSKLSKIPTVPVPEEDPSDLPPIIGSIEEYEKLFGKKLMAPTSEPWSSPAPAVGTDPGGDGGTIQNSSGGAAAGTSDETKANQLVAGNEIEEEEDDDDDDDLWGDIMGNS